MNRIRKKSLSELDLSTITQITLSAEDEKQFEKGIALFNAEKFWEAHEAWEEIWMRHPEDGRFFIQGLIQLAAGYHQLRRKIYRGFVIHLRRAQERFVLFPGNFLGVNVRDLLSAIDSSLSAINAKENSDEAESPRMIFPEIERSSKQRRG